VTRYIRRGAAGVLLIGLVLPCLFGQGCVPPNQPPVADAGAAQTVAFGALVTLNGSGSYDPDGDPITYQWTQTGGLSVTLKGSTTAEPTFTAPSTATVLSFRLTVSDNHGGTSSASTIVTVKSSVTRTPQLFVANRTSNSVTSYRNPAKLNGNVAPDTNVTGGQTQLGTPSDMVVTAGGSLLVSNFASSSFTIYPNAVDVTGNVAPSAIVQGSATLLESVTSLQVNASKDLVFVSEIGFINRVVVFANASSSGFNGNVPAARTISSASMVNPLGIHLAANDDLYVANNGLGNVIVFAKASSLDGFVLPDRSLSSASFAAVVDLDVDAGDRLYVVNGPIGNNQVSIYNHASTLNNFVVADAMLIVSGAQSLAAIEIDAAGTGYILDAGAAAIYVYDKIATRNGTLPPDRTIQGQNTQLIGPIRMFLLE
jgi:hypothetical protein